MITTQDGVSGYRRIPDDVIKLIVEGEYNPAPELIRSDSDGLERYLPLKQDCLGEFVPGPPSQPAYRTGVGSKELYKRVYSRAAMRAGVLFRDPALFEARTGSLVGDYTRRYTPYQP